VTCYSLALGDPVPRRIDAALVGDPAAHAPTVRAVEGVAQNSITVFQAGSQAGPLRPRHWTVFVVALAVGASLAFTLVDGPLLDRVALPVLAVASFASLMLRLSGRWAIVPTWLFFTILGNSASGGAVAPPLLQRPFAISSPWLPSGATVNALRNAVYFNGFQHAQPLAVLAAWAAVLFAAMGCRVAGFRVRRA
jgi:hypothetical protein